MFSHCDGDLLAVHEIAAIPREAHHWPTPIGHRRTDRSADGPAHCPELRIDVQPTAGPPASLVELRRHRGTWKRLALLPTVLHIQAMNGPGEAVPAVCENSDAGRHHFRQPMQEGGWRHPACTRRRTGFLFNSNRLGWEGAPALPKVFRSE